MRRVRVHRPHVAQKPVTGVLAARGLVQRPRNAREVAQATRKPEARMIENGISQARDRRPGSSRPRRAPGHRGEASRGPMGTSTPVRLLWSDAQNGSGWLGVGWQSVEAGPGILGQIPFPREVGQSRVWPAEGWQSVRLGLGILDQIRVPGRRRVGGHPGERHPPAFHGHGDDWASPGVNQGVGQEI